MLLLVAFGRSNCESQKHVTDIGFWAQPILNQMLQSANVETLLPQLPRFIDPPVKITVFALGGLFPGCSHKGEGADSVKTDAKLTNWLPNVAWPLNVMQYVRRMQFQYLSFGTNQEAPPAVVATFLRSRGFNIVQETVPLVAGIFSMACEAGHRWRRNTGCMVHCLNPWFLKVDITIIHCVLGIHRLQSAQ